MGMLAVKFIDPMRLYLPGLCLLGSPASVAALSEQEGRRARSSLGLGREPPPPGGVMSNGTVTLSPGNMTDLCCQPGLPGGDAPPAAVMDMVILEGFLEHLLHGGTGLALAECTEPVIKGLQSREGSVSRSNLTQCRERCSRSKGEQGASSLGRLPGGGNTCWLSSRRARLCRKSEGRGSNNITVGNCGASLKCNKMIC